MNRSGVAFKSLQKTHFTLNAFKLTKSRCLPKQFSQATELRRVLNAAAKQYSINQLKDWYNLPTKDYSNLLADQSFEKDFQSSPFQLLSSAYPEYDWLPWRFENCPCPAGYWDDASNRITFITFAAEQLKIKEMSDWYNVSNKSLERLGGGALLKKASLYELLSTIYPDYDWLPWKFERCPVGYWNDIKNVHKFMDWAGKQLNVKQKSDWHNVPSTEIKKLGGDNLLLLKSSYFDLLNEIYPEYDWLPWKFVQLPNGYWNDIKNVRKFMDWAGKELGVKEMSDWYNVQSTDLKNIGGRYLVSSKPSYIDLLTEVYPDYDWLPWRFEQCPKHYWHDIKNVRKFMNWAGNELNIKEMSDWYNISVTDLRKLKASSYLVERKSSYFELLKEVYPEYDWLPWKFEKIPDGYWRDKKNVRKFMDWAGKQLNVKEMSDWYNVSSIDLKKVGGEYLLQLQSSFVDLLIETYPEYDWLLWKFKSFSSKTLITYPIRKQKYLKWIANQLNIKDMNDWYKIKAKQIIDLRGGILLIENSSLAKLVSTMYSEYTWKESKFEEQSDIWTDITLANYFVEWLKKQEDKEISMICQYVKQSGPKEGDVLTRALQQAFPNKWIRTASQNTKKSQYLLKECIESIFNRGSATVLLEEYKHPQVVNLELDYYLPEYKIAFEYQGQQHYKTAFHHRGESVETMKERDRSKIESCKELGITLIEVPYWWDRKINSLAATIYNERPDLFDIKPEGVSIPSSPPQNKESEVQKTNVSKQVLMTATEWNYDTMEPKGWFMTEKYDGIRFYWDGTQCYSRQGNKINIPISMSSQLPPVALDGELWTQYGLHQDAVHLVNTTKEDMWNKAIFWIFDAPELNKPLEERISFLQQLQLPSFAKVVEFVKCEGKEHLKHFNDSIIAKGGEGVMLREPQSMYKQGRSTSLRKFKPYFDTEVKVVKSQYPQGFVCEQLNGKTVFVNTENSEEAKAIKKGAVITVKHSGTNVYGTLQYPQFYRERTDVTWNELQNKAT